MQPYESDEAIVLGLRRREEAALEAMQSRYQGYLLKIATSFLPNPSDAEECVSDCLQRLWEAPPGEATGEDLRHYAAKILRHTAISRQRTEQRQKRGGGNAAISISEWEALLPGGDTPEEQIEQKELTEILNRFLRQLPASDRQIFLRRYWYMQPIAEIARSVGKKEQAVRTGLCRLREQLRKELKKQGYGSRI